MPVSYRKLYDLMDSKGLKKFWLRQQGINPKVVDALYKGNNVNVGTIMELCRLLDVQPGDIMEYMPEEKTESG